MSRPAFTPEQAMQLRAEYEAGATIAQLEERHHAANSTVRRALLRAGTPMRPGGFPSRRPRVIETVDLAYDGAWVRDGLILRPAVRT